MSDPKEIVRSGYDAIAERYEVWAWSFDAPEGRWVESFLARLKYGSNVLDLGCGGGRAAAQAVAARHRYTGVDRRRCRGACAGTNPAGGVPRRGRGAC